MKLDPEIEYSAWHKPSKEINFGVNANTSTISLKDIPIHAKEIKAHVYIQCGYLPENRYISWYFSTLFDAAKIQCYLYGQQAIAFSNEVITLQLDGKGFIDVTRNGDYPSNYFHFTFEIILYR